MNVEVQETILRLIDKFTEWEEIKSFEVKDDCDPPWIIVNVYRQLSEELANDIYRTANPFQVLVMRVDPKVEKEQTPEEKTKESRIRKILRS